MQRKSDRPGQDAREGASPPAERAREVLAECSRALVRATDDQQLLRDMCRIAVDTGGYRLAWVGLARKDPGRTIEPVASAGYDEGYLASIRVSWGDDEFGQGPAGQAVRTGQSRTLRDIKTEPGFGPWLKAALARGYRAVAALPLEFEGETFGVFAIAAGEARAFDTEEVRLLEELADDIAYGVGNLRRREAQQRAEAAIESSERRFRTTFDLAPIGITHIDPDGRVLLANPQMEKILGYPAGELVGRRMGEFVWHEDEEVRKDLLERRAELHAGKIESFTKEIRYRHKKGFPVWVGLTVAIHRDGAGRPLYDISAVEDITTRKRDEQLLALEHAVSVSIAEADNESAAVQATIRAICEKERWDCGRYWRVDDKAGVLRLHESWSIPAYPFREFLDQWKVVVYRPGEGLAGKAWQSREPQWAADITQDERMGQKLLALRSGFRGVFAFPVVSEGKAIGVFVFNSGEVRERREDLVQAIRAISSQIGQFLKRKQAEEELRRFRLAMDGSGDMVVLIDRATMRYLDVNATACRLLGYTREELLMLGPPDLVAMSQDELARQYDALIADPSAGGSVNALMRCKDGTLLPLESTRRVLRSGDATIIVAVSRDIRERIAADTALKQSNERFDIAVRATNDVVWDWNLLTDQVWWNENFAKVFGYPRGLAFPSDGYWRESIHPDDRERVVSSVRHVIDSGEGNWSGEYRIRRADGSYAHVLDRGHVIRDQNGRGVRMIGALTDITARKEVEEKIRDQARRQRLIAEFGQRALASTDLGEVLKRGVELVSSTLDSDYCNLLELDREGKHLTFKAAVGWPQEWIGRRTVPVRPGTRAELALSRREPLIVDDYQQDADAASPFLTEYGVRSGVVAPLFGTTGTFGIMSAHSMQPRRFTEDEVNFLRNVAYIVAVAIERSKSEERLAYLAQFDSLTGLPNRHLFHDRLTQTMVQAKRSGRPMAVLFIDLDRFKLVNDTLGHSTGDRLLKEAAARLSQCVRSGDTVGRFGGDEFGAILADLNSVGDAGLVAQKILEALDRPFSLQGNETYVTASIGVTLFPDDGNEAGALIMNSDTAMYRAKEQGRNNYQYFTREMNERALARVQMEAALRRAIERREFRLHYQPKVDLRSGEICGAEALLRWQHPERGMVPPEEFIPVLEDTGLIVPVGEWVMREACTQTMAWKRSGLAALPVAVNLSARQFQQKDLESIVRYVLADSGVDPSLIEFELTESLLMKDPEAAARTLRGLKRAGARISVDDFGTGYSSLAYLKRFPIDALKIDGAFIRDLTTDPGDAAITLAIIGLAHGLKLKVVAECVETESQLKFLSSHACDEMQGYFFSRPAAPEEFEAMLREGRRLQRSSVLSGKPPVLLLDDNEQDLLLLEEILRTEGFPVLKTTDPRRAFELLASHPAGIAISDQGMPGMSGVEFLGHVRKLYPDMVRILVTGAHDPDAIADAVNEAGIQKFLSKDWDGERLRAEVREMYRKHFPSEDAKSPSAGARNI